MAKRRELRGRSCRRSRFWQQGLGTPDAVELGSADGLKIYNVLSNVFCDGVLSCLRPPCASLYLVMGLPVAMGSTVADGVWAIINSVFQFCIAHNPLCCHHDGQWVGYIDNNRTEGVCQEVKNTLSAHQ